jgi:hypothetical protein
MTTCAECLTAISTSGVSDLAPGSAVALHCATCANCSRVAEEVRYAEYRLATALNEQRSGLDSSEVTVAALKGSERLRRSRVARRIQIALIVAGCYVFYVFVEQRRQPDPRALDNLPAIPEAVVDAHGIATRTMTLKCMTPDQAMAIATPYLRSNAAVYSVPGMSAITLRGNREEFRRAVSAIEQLDGQCQLPRATTPPPATSPATPGKD